MKFLKKPLLPALLAGSLHTAPIPALASTSIQFNGHDYIAVKMGRTAKITPAGVSAHLTPAGADDSGPANPVNPGCEAIYSELQRREYAFETCRQQPNQSLCRVLVSGLRLLAEGRPDTDTPIDPRVAKAWTIGAPSMEEADLAGLRSSAAEQLQMKAESIDVVNTGAQPRFGATPILALAQGSASEKVSRLVDFRLDDLAQLQGSGRLVTKNNIFACDLAAGKAAIVAQTSSTLRGLDHVPDPVVDLAWAAHRELEQAAGEIQSESSPLVRAAVIGFHLGSVLGQGGAVDDPLATPAALFRRLYDMTGAQPELRPAASREALRASIYPDVSFEEAIGQSWRLQ